MNNENNYLSVGQVAKLLGIAVVTVRRWEKIGKLTSCFRTFGNHRRYSKHDIFRLLNNNKKTICYSRVSSHDQKKDLLVQEQKLLHFCEKNKLNKILPIL